MCKLVILLEISCWRWPYFYSNEDIHTQHCGDYEQPRVAASHQESTYIWDQAVYGKTFPTLVVIDYPRGTPWVERKKDSHKEDSPFCDLWREIPWPNPCSSQREQTYGSWEENICVTFPLWGSSKYVFYKKWEAYGKMVKMIHDGSVQKSLDFATHMGLTCLDYKAKAQLMSDDNGPIPRPREYSIWDLLMKMNSGEACLWQSVFIEHT